MSVRTSWVDLDVCHELWLNKELSREREDEKRLMGQKLNPSILKLFTHHPIQTPPPSR